jgi:hypothetical protein
VGLSSLDGQPAPPRLVRGLESTPTDTKMARRRLPPGVPSWIRAIWLSALEHELWATRRDLRQAVQSNKRRTRQSIATLGDYPVPWRALCLGRIAEPIRPSTGSGRGMGVWLGHGGRGRGSTLSLEVEGPRVERAGQKHMAVARCGYMIRTPSACLAHACLLLTIWSSGRRTEGSGLKALRVLACCGATTPVCGGEG